MSELQYTQSERLNKKYTIQDIVEAARARLKANRQDNMCINALKRYTKDDRFTLAELNLLADSIVDDTYYPA